jgi:hypothetical protein
MDIQVNTEDQEVVINMDSNASQHLEFEVKEDEDGTYRVIEHFTSGGRLIYAGFPNRHEAEKFVLAQPDCWE